MMIEMSLHIQVVLAGACIITSSVTAGNNSVPGGRIKIKLCLGYYFEQIDANNISRTTVIL